MKFEQKSFDSIINIVLVGILLSSILFHVMVGSGVIPYEIVWGGRIQSVEEMYIFESISLMVNATLLFFVLIRISILSLLIPPKIVTVVLYLASFVLLLNTVGNLVSLNNFERVVFTPITLILAILLFRLARKSGI